MDAKSYAGIDYGLGRSNIGDEGIRYGVINQNKVGQVWYDESEPYYWYCCPYCGGEIGETLGVFDFYNEKAKCKDCEHELTEQDFDDCEPTSWVYNQNNEGYVAECSEYDIFILKSPYFTYAQFCSPCAPGACHLENPLIDKIDNNKCYCFGHDWFEDEVAPYPVYSIETGKIVKPKNGME